VERGADGPAPALQTGNEYAKAAMADPDVRANYEELAAIAHKHPYRIAFSDYFQGKDLLAQK